MSDPCDIVYRSATDRPLLTVERERALAVRSHAGEVKARNELVEANVRYVFWIARRFEPITELPYEDLVQEGMFGLIRAAELFDPSLGYRFTTYAHAWIVQAVQRGIYDRSRTVRIPVHQMERKRRLEKEEARAVAEGEDLALDDLARNTKIPVEAIELIRKAHQYTVPLDKPVFNDGDATIAEIIPDEQGEDAFDAVLAAYSDQTGKLRRMVTDRQWEVLDLRLGLTGAEPMTLREIGERLGLTRERVRQIEAAGLEKVRDALVN
ncbi:MAG: sigma-70 family RNA polymerase sigma factor [Actinobacteria bacterium]|nr:sigma-70 family RNA polymerase sigma factor [Actinomycetota bacterium]